tara:strand:- start:4227 stop:4613 length:387 start_codon:yes stop_codon:yes gene_type:complete
MASQWADISTKNKAKMLGAARRTIKSIAKDTVAGSPIDTGRFKSNWNASLGSPDLAIDKTEGGGFIPVANKLRIGDIFYFVNNLPYALRLEFGYSDQAPSGMVRLAIAKFPFTVNKITTAFINRPVIE